MSTTALHERRIEAMPRLGEPPERRPIDSAPHDGTLILAWNRGAKEPSLVRFEHGCWRNNHYGPREPVWHFAALAWWQPLPEPPGCLGSGEAADEVCPACGGWGGAEP